MIIGKDNAILPARFSCCVKFSKNSEIDRNYEEVLENFENYFSENFLEKSKINKKPRGNNFAQISREMSFRKVLEDFRWIFGIASFLPPNKSSINLISSAVPLKY